MIARVHRPLPGRAFPVRADAADATVLPVAAHFVLIQMALLVALALGDTVVHGTLVGLALYATLGATAAARALSMIAVIKFVNPTLVELSDTAFTLTWVVVFWASARILVTCGLRNAPFLAPLWAFALAAAGLALVGSAAVQVSLVKVLAFAFVGSAALAVFRGSSDRQRRQTIRWFGSLFATIALLSVPTLLAPEVGYARNGRGFQGILAHPQALGSFLVPAVVWSTIAIARTRGRIPLLGLGGVGLLWMLMVLTEARTAVIASILALIATALAVRIFAAPRRAERGNSVVAKLLLAAAAVSVAAMFIPEVASTIFAFTLKGSRGAELAQAFYDSRGWMIEQHWHHFLERPWTGHGFGVYPSGVFPSGVTRMFGVPVSAPVEKGFLPTALLEEVGLIGAAAFAVLVLALGRAVVSSGDARSIGLFFACLAINLGECVLFATGGLGLLSWLLVGQAAAANGRARHAP
jgi:hypothetical protein